MKHKQIKVLIMSVGDYAQNWTLRYLIRIGGKEHCLVCLPKQFEDNAEGYIRRGVEVFVYDETKYINKDFEYFGFNPRNCGGVGRQGIAEAVEKYGDDFICFQMDDDTGGMVIHSTTRRKSSVIKKWDVFAKMVYLLNDFYEATGIELAARTGATPPKGNGSFLSNRKIFNNFIMRKGNPLNFQGFAALCSDDYRYNLYRNLLQCTPMLSSQNLCITFHQSQGDRDDGNAVIYNSDCSWKKSLSLKMIMPASVVQYVSKETNRALFREYYNATEIFPPIYLEGKGLSATL